MKAMAGFGFRRTFTPDELAEIARLRHEMRERLTCPDADYERICAAQGIPTQRAETACPSPFMGSPVAESDAPNQEPQP